MGNINKFDQKRKKEIKILKCLKENDKISISELAKKIGINRLTLNYYLKGLEQDKTIIRIRSLKEKGRPTYFQIDAEKYDWIVNFDAKYNAEKLKEQLDVLRIVRDNPYIDDIKLMDELEKIGGKEYGVDASTDIVNEGYAKMLHIITEKGKKLLEDHKKE